MRPYATDDIVPTATMSRNIVMADQIIELLEIMEEDPAWLSEFYSAAANSELIMPVILRSGRGEPVPMATRQYSERNLVFNTFLNDYIPCGSSIDGYLYCLLYSSRDVYESVKPVLYEKFQHLGTIMEPLVQNGRQIFNRFCRKKQCAIINLFAPGVPQYRFSFDQMEIIQRTPVIAKPKAALAAPVVPEVSIDGALLQSKQNHDAVEKLERGIRQLQAHLAESLKENAELKARLSSCEKLIFELESGLTAACDAGVPVTVGEAVENAARRYASRLIIHPKAKDVAESWTYKKKPVCVAHTVKMLDAVARTLYGMKFESPDGYVDPLQFQRLTGYELAMTEGKLTKRNQNLDALRCCRYEDNKVSIYAHLKKRIAHNLQMRIYIGFIEEERKIFVGHVGPHLATSQTPVRRVS